MRQGRLRAGPEMPVAYYHCVSRVVDRAFKLGDPQVKTVFVRMMVTHQATASGAVACNV